MLGCPTKSYCSYAYYSYTKSTHQLGWWNYAQNFGKLYAAI